MDKKKIFLQPSILYFCDSFRYKVLKHEVCGALFLSTCLLFWVVLVVDVYQGWCGPCTVLTPFLKALREEVPPKDMKLTAAECDNIEPLKFYKGKCQPTFQLFCVSIIYFFIIEDRNFFHSQINP